MTPEGRGIVTESNVLTGKLKVRLDKAPDSPAVDMMREDVTAIVRDNNRPKANPEASATEEAPVAEAAAPAQPPRQPNPAENKGGKSDHRPRRNRPRNKRQG